MVHVIRKFQIVFTDHKIEVLTRMNALMTAYEGIRVFVVSFPLFLVSINT